MPHPRSASDNPEHPYAQIAALVADCEKRGRPLHIRHCASNQPAAGGEPGAVAEFDCGRFARVLAHDRDDLTVTVQAGMTVSALQALLAEHRQHLPIDVPQPQRTTLGAMIAADLSGSRRHFRGGVRDLLLGIGAIGAGGRFLRFGGRVVKNVAGYDLCKLYTGSHGWLGVIVEATFRVYPIPEAAAGIAVSLQTSGQAEAAFAALQASPLQPSAVDLLDQGMTEWLDLPASPWTLLLAFEDLREVVDAQLAECRDLFDAALTTLGPAEISSSLQRIADAGMSDGLHIRFNLLSSDAGGFISRLAQRRPAERRPAPRLWSHFADGVVHALFDPADAQGLHEAAELAAGAGGSWMIPRRDSVAAAGLPMFGPPRPEWRLMRRIKSALDPGDIFGRGTPFDAAMRQFGQGEA